jgi:hypothetical protein
MMIVNAYLAWFAWSVTPGSQFLGATGLGKKDMIIVMSQLMFPRHKSAMILTARLQMTTLAILFPCLLMAKQ